MGWKVFAIIFDDNLNDKVMELGKIIGRMVLGDQALLNLNSRKRP